MTRQIVLRYDATCFDCGSPLSAGTTARWFGKGRVSCCGKDGDAYVPIRPGHVTTGRVAPVSKSPTHDVSAILEGLALELDACGFEGLAARLRRAKGML